MIDMLQGTIMSLSRQRIIVMVRGVGYGVQVPSENIFGTQQEVTLFIYTNWTQEHGPSLFGFLSSLDKQVFALIISCSGIGPKIGLATLTTMSSSNFIAVVTSGDTKTLSTVPGIGLKKAEAMVLHLRDKVAQLLESGIVLEESAQSARFINEVSEVLLSLNYSRTETTHALEYVKKHNDIAQQTFDSLLRKALGFLAQ